MEANNDVFFFQTKNEEIEKPYVSNRWRRAGNRLEKFLHDSVQLFEFLSLFRPIHKYTIGRDSNEIEKRINANSPIISTSV